MSAFHPSLPSQAGAFMGAGGLLSMIKLSGEMAEMGG
jgi:hypothetical protein